jgi:hypothetical protein
VDSLLDRFLLECWRIVWRSFVAFVSMSFVLGVVLGQLLAWGVSVILMAGVYTLGMGHLEKYLRRKYPPITFTELDSSD